MVAGLEPSVEIATVPPETNEVEMLESKGGNLIRSNVVMTQPGILAGTPPYHHHHTPHTPLGLKTNYVFLVTTTRSQNWSHPVLDNFLYNFS